MEEKSISRDQKIMKITRENPDNIRSVPVNDFIVNHDQDQFFMTFSSIEPPIILDENDLMKTNTVIAIARAKIVVSIDFAEKILKTLSTLVESRKNEKTDNEKTD